MTENNNDINTLFDTAKDDYVVTATALDGAVQAFAVRSTVTCRELVNIHSLSPVSAAALGRVASMLLMMSRDIKNDNGIVSVSIKGDGEIGGIFAVCTSDSFVRGYVVNPVIETRNKANGKLDVGGAVGKGTLTVIKDLGMKEPYTGQIELVSGEIAEDFAAYFMISEQIPSVVSLGVRMNSEGVTHAGGMMIRLLPDAGDDIINYLEQRASGFPEISWLYEEGFTPEQVLDLFLGDPNIEYYAPVKCGQRCSCSRDRMIRNLSLLSRDDIEHLLDLPTNIELNCHFCNTTYSFTHEEIRSLAIRDIIQPGAADNIG